MTEPSEDKYYLDLDSSAAVQAVRSATPPPVLFHYTSRASLLGILASRRVFASSIRYLNDSQEFEHAASVAIEVISARKQAASGEEVQLYDEIAPFLSGVKEQASVYVFSLSENGDQLSQWRAYCRPLDGYAIGFDSQALAAASPDFLLARCEYRTLQQRQLVERLLDDARSSFSSNRSSGTSLPTACAGASAYFLLGFLVVAPVLKHPAFQEEAEWRLITKPLKGFGAAGVTYRAGASMLVPHFELTLSTGGPLPIKEIVVGPTPHRELELRSVAALLTSYGITPGARLSGIPYRPW